MPSVESVKYYELLRGGLVMSASNLVYNEPFEFEKWVWEINGTRYCVNKYRKIDCDKEADFYYDFIVIEVNHINGVRLFHIRKYNDDNRMSFFCNPYLEINKNLPDMLQKLKEKYQVKNFYYFEIGKGYQKLE